MIDTVKNYEYILDSIKNLIKTENISHDVTLVCVSKTKPIEQILQVYNGGARHFGENYVQELVEKARCAPEGIIWHFIGHLQTNKVKRVASINNIIIETIDSIKLAEALNKACVNSISIFIEVKTSDEVSKHGIEVSELPSLVGYILTSCPKLILKGLMTIGNINDSKLSFQILNNCKNSIMSQFSLPNLQLSMGMSNDYLEAIRMGSNNVRVGTKIFGERIYKTDIKTEEKKV